MTNTQNDSDKQSLEKIYHTKITELENKIPSVTRLVATTVLIRKPERLKTKYLI